MIYLHSICLYLILVFVAILPLHSDHICVSVYMYTHACACVYIHNVYINKTKAYINFHVYKKARKYSRYRSFIQKRTIIHDDKNSRF